MPTILTLETKKYSIKIDNFEGPLDLLIYLIEKNKMDIYDINLTEITDQYIEYLNAMEEMNLEIASEFLIMASSLLYLKSKKLLPKQEDETEAVLSMDLLQDFSDKETAFQVHKALHKLAEPYKEVFSLRVFGELAFADISSLFGKSESWARVTYHRACKKIREELKHEDQL